MSESELKTCNYVPAEIHLRKYVLQECTYIHMDVHTYVHSPAGSLS